MTPDGGALDHDASKDERAPGGPKTDVAPAQDAAPTCGTSATPAMPSCPATPAMPKLLYLPVELAVGDTQMVTLLDGTKAKIQLLKLDEQMQSYAHYIETARVLVAVNGEQKWIGVGEYN